MHRRLRELLGRRAGKVFAGCGEGVLDQPGAVKTIGPGSAVLVEVGCADLCKSH